MPRKSRRNNNFLKRGFKSVKNTTSKVVPKIEKGLVSVGNAVSSTTQKAVPAVKSGLFGIFNIFKKGTNYAVTGAKNLVTRTNRRRHKKTRKH